MTLSNKSLLEQKSDVLWQKYVRKSNSSSTSHSTTFSKKFWKNYDNLLSKSKANKTPLASELVLQDDIQKQIKEKYQEYWEYNNLELNGEISIQPSLKLFNIYKLTMIGLFVVYVSFPENSIIATVALMILIFSAIIGFGVALLIRLSHQKTKCALVLQETQFVYNLHLKPESVKVNVPYTQIKKFKTQGDHIKVIVRDHKKLTYSGLHKQKQIVLIPLEIENTFHLRRFLDDIIQINQGSNT